MLDVAPTLPVTSAKVKRFPDQCASEFAEAVTVVHVLPVIEAKCLFVHVSEQMEGLNAYIGAAQAALKQTPEVFQAVSVDVANGIGFGVIDDIVREFGLESKVCHGLISEQRCDPDSTLLLNRCRPFPAVAALLDPLKPNLSAAFEDALNGSFSDNTTALALKHSLLTILVHVSLRSCRR